MVTENPKTILDHKFGSRCHRDLGRTPWERLLKELKFIRKPFSIAHGFRNRLRWKVRWVGLKIFKCSENCQVTWDFSNFTSKLCTKNLQLCDTSLPVCTAIKLPQIQAQGNSWTLIKFCCAEKRQIFTLQFILNDEQSVTDECKQSNCDKKQFQKHQQSHQTRWETTHVN